MRITLFAAILAAAAFTAAATGAGSDPRKCSIGTVAKSAAYCAGASARLSIRARFGDGDITCTAVDSKYLAWVCTRKVRAPDGSSEPFMVGKSKVVFRALSTGWHTLVTVMQAPVLSAG